MPNLLISVAISTFNRKVLLGRAIQSVLDQAWPNMDIVVVDDASTDGTQEFIAHYYPQTRYFRLEENQGCGAARNRALLEAIHSYVLILDDDDTLLPGSLHLISARMEVVPDLCKHPVVNFAHGNACVSRQYLCATLGDYLGEGLSGDFIPVINRSLFQQDNLMYPLSRVGGEHLLWWRIAERYGIPTWADRVGTVNTDAPTRLTSVDSQIYYAREHAELQERTLNEFGDVLMHRFPAYYTKKLIGAGTYRFLADDRIKARLHLHAAARSRLTPSIVALWVLTFLPLSLAIECFRTYRRMRTAAV